MLPGFIKLLNVQQTKFFKLGLHDPHPRYSLIPQTFRFVPFLTFDQQRILFKIRRTLLPTRHISRHTAPEALVPGGPTTWVPCKQGPSRSSHQTQSGGRRVEVAEDHHLSNERTCKAQTPHPPTHSPASLHEAKCCSQANVKARAQDHHGSCNGLMQVTNQRVHFRGT